MAYKTKANYIKTQIIGSKDMDKEATAIRRMPYNCILDIRFIREQLTTLPMEEAIRHIFRGEMVFDSDNFNLGYIYHYALLVIIGTIKIIEVKKKEVWIKPKPKVLQKTTQIDLFPSYATTPIDLFPRKAIRKITKKKDLAINLRQNDCFFPMRVNDAYETNLFDYPSFETYFKLPLNLEGFPSTCIIENQELKKLAQDCSNLNFYPEQKKQFLSWVKRCLKDDSDLLLVYC